MSSITFRTLGSFLSRLHRLRIVSGFSFHTGAMIFSILGMWFFYPILYNALAEYSLATLLVYIPVIASNHPAATNFMKS